jgi:hypothetical protein
MEAKRNLDFEVKTSSDLVKMLCGSLMDVRRGNLDFETVKAITLIADKINKAMVNDLVYKGLTRHKNDLEFFEEPLFLE